MRPQLLLLPGLACDAESWAQQSGHFSAITEVRVADYGASDSIQAMARSALRGSSERFAIAAHSMGGRVAFEIYRSARERIAGLALLDTAYRGQAAGKAAELERAARMELVEIADKQGMRAMARHWIRNMVHPERLADAAFVERIVAMFDRKSPEIYRGQVNALLNRPDATPVLATIRCPALVLCGREDTWSPVAQHEEIASRIA
ncbi:MAG: alpha/beta fold hydrolase, partial [Acidobacteriota bacterium]|nr:alpha/beta fold hydrolase [Acidobacteriota bacterium]